MHEYTNNDKNERVVSKVRIYVARDGSAIPLGFVAVRTRDESARRIGRDGQPNERTRQILVAQALGTQAACADWDGDGVGGLTHLTIRFLDTAEAAVYTLVAEPAAGADIHEKGRYLTVVTLFAPDGSQTVFDGLLRLPKDLNVPR